MPTPEELEILAIEMRKVRKAEVDARTDDLFNEGIPWNGHVWHGDKAHLDDYLQACQAIQSGLEASIIIKSKDDAYIQLDATNVADFYTSGKTFKLTVLGDSYKIKDLGGTLSNGITVKAIKDMDYYELVYWTDPRS